MPFELRICLLLGALFILGYFLFQIRCSRMQIQYAISWSLFGLLLVFFGLFPGVVGIFASLFGIQSPSNLLFLFLLVTLIIKNFFSTLRFSKMDRQITELTQHIAFLESDLSSTLSQNQSSKLSPKD